MKAPEPQNYRNHRRFIPLYHLVLFGILVVNLLWSLLRVVKTFSADAAIRLLLALALLGIFFYMRIFAITVQDRVIRLEMRLRLKEVLPSELRGRIWELTPSQLIGLRFASDSELPELVRDVLANDIRDRDVIKRRVRDWQADHLRC